MLHLREGNRSRHPGVLAAGLNATEPARRGIPACSRVRVPGSGRRPAARPACPGGHRAVRAGGSAGLACRPGPVSIHAHLVTACQAGRHRAAAMAQPVAPRRHGQPGGPHTEALAGRAARSTGPLYCGPEVPPGRPGQDIVGHGRPSAHPLPHLYGIPRSGSTRTPAFTGHAQNPRPARGGSEADTASSPSGTGRPLAEAGSGSTPAPGPGMPCREGHLPRPQSGVRAVGANTSGQP